VTHDGSHSEAVHALEHAEDEAHDGSSGSHGGHGADPNAGVLRGEPPTPAWLGVIAVIVLVTVAFCVWLAYKIG
jgi:hypothetical protein